MRAPFPSRRGSLGWTALISGALALETWAIRTGDNQDWPTLSTLIGRHVPKWTVGLGLAVLSAHLLRWKER